MRRILEAAWCLAALFVACLCAIPHVVAAVWFWSAPRRNHREEREL